MRQGRVADTPASWWDVASELRQVAESDPVRALRMLAGIERSIELDLPDVARAARDRGLTWEQIGAALGVTKQAAGQRLARLRRECPRKYTGYYGPGALAVDATRMAVTGCRGPVEAVRVILSEAEPDAAQRARGGHLFCVEHAAMLRADAGAVAWLYPHGRGNADAALAAYRRADELRPAPGPAAGATTASEPGEPR
jgi:hypothetical protein